LRKHLSVTVSPSSLNSADPPPAPAVPVDDEVDLAALTALARFASITACTLGHLWGRGKQVSKTRMWFAMQCTDEDAALTPARTLFFLKLSAVVLMIAATSCARRNSQTQRNAWLTQTRQEQAEANNEQENSVVAHLGHLVRDRALGPLV